MENYWLSYRAIKKIILQWFSAERNLNEVSNILRPNFTTNIWIAFDLEEYESWFYLYSFDAFVGSYSQVQACASIQMRY